MNATITAQYAQANETNGLVDAPAYHAETDYRDPHTLRRLADAGGRIDRLRIFKESGRVDVSYIIGVLPDGRRVPIHVGVENFIPRRAFKGALIEWAKAEGVYAKGVGLLDEGRWSTLA